jgi:hypothetical protein
MPMDVNMKNSTVETTCIFPKDFRQMVMEKNDTYNLGGCNVTE